MSVFKILKEKSAHRSQYAAVKGKVHMEN